jgi:hypothetical protein
VSAWGSSFRAKAPSEIITGVRRRNYPCRIRNVLQRVPPGSRLLVIMDVSGWSNPPLVHAPLPAAAKRGIFIPRR